MYLVRKAERSGMKISFPIYLNRIDPSKELLEKTILTAKDDHCTFILFVQSDRACLHGCPSFF